jgi:hypothetical protein
LKWPPLKKTLQMKLENQHAKTHCHWQNVSLILNLEDSVFAREKKRSSIPLLVGGAQCFAGTAAFTLPAVLPRFLV